MSSNLLSPKEAADFLKVSEKTLEGWRCAEVGPKFYRMGNRRIRYFKSDVEAWVKSEAADKTKTAKKAPKLKLGISIEAPQC